MSSEVVTANIRNRRTVKPRQVADRTVEEAVINEMLENANWAPTHGLTEPWRFTVFTGEARTRLAERLAATYQEITPADQFKRTKYDSYASNAMRVPVVISIAMKRQETEKIPEIEEIQAVACAVQNMHLTATSHGIGGFWSSNRAVCSEQMKSFLGLDAKDAVLGLFYVGYPAGDWPTGERTPIEQKVTWRSE